MNTGRYYKIYIENEGVHMHIIGKAINKRSVEVIYRISGSLWEGLPTLAVNPGWIKREIDLDEYPEYFI